MSSNSDAPPSFRKTITVPINVSREVMYKALLDKIRHPERYIQARDVKILGEGADYVDREMTVGPPTAPMMERERITWDDVEQSVTFTSVDNPQKEGVVKNIVSEDGGKFYLTFTLDWQWKPDCDRAKALAFIAAIDASGDKGVRATANAAEQLHSTSQA